MIYTVSDFLASHVSQVRLVAGEGGLARAVDAVGILDYELMPGLKSRYQRVNFTPNQLVLSTFLYAKDDPWLIVEALKYLVGRGVSGLVIKNVFHLQIGETALRYANARDFPLMVTTSDDFFFDVAIAEVDRRVSELANADFAQAELDLMLAEGTSPDEVRTHALRLNPSFGEEHVAIFAGSLPQGGLPVASERLHRSELAGLGNLLVEYEGGLLYVASAESDVAQDEKDVRRMADVLRADVLDNEVTAPVGVGSVHFHLDEANMAVREAMLASVIAQRQGGGVVRYDDLGVLRAVLPFAKTPEMQRFADGILGPLRDYDAETGSRLMETLSTYCEKGESVGAAAKALGQHPNTIRYRLDKVTTVTGLSWKARPQMDQLAMACSIALGRELLER